MIDTQINNRMDRMYTYVKYENNPWVPPTTGTPSQDLFGEPSALKAPTLAKWL